jgi:hypothetical protein
LLLWAAQVAPRHVAEMDIEGGDGMKTWGIRVLAGCCAACTLTTSGVPLQAQVEAVVGTPFGVADLTIEFPATDALTSVGMAPLHVTSADGRVLYPAFNQGFMTRLLGRQPPAPRRLNVMFLFTGDRPFDVVIRTPTPQQVRIVPVQRPAAAHARLQRRWWRYYTAFLRDQAGDGSYPAVVETYLAAMLARRLNLDEPLLQRWRNNSTPSEGRQALELITGAERLRLEVLRAVCLGNDLDTQTATQPLPVPVSWRAPGLSDTPAEVAIEPLARRVPAECFYVRFGQFVNYLWLQALLEDYGGDLATMITARGQHASASQRVGDQLVLRQNVLAQLLGPHVIADMAVIGMDMFTREGAAIGVVFEARNQLLGVDLARQRQEALDRERQRGAVATTVTIAGRDVSFLSTPDNRLRSFYLVDGSYHLVTNSRTIVQRFLEVRDGAGSLGTSAEFRHARANVPTTRDDTIFLFLPTKFFEQLFSPAYQIELERRMRAAAEIQQLELARWAARAEGQPGDTREQLIAAQVLPRGMGQRPDGSAPQVTADTINDSLRGALGYFTPVPDMNVERVSPREASRFAVQRDYYANNWQQFEPLLLVIQRTPQDAAGRERITIDGFVSPLADTKYARFLASLGEPTQYHLVPPEGNVILVEAALRGGMLFPRVPAHTMFLGIQDHAPLATHAPDNLLRWLSIVRTTPAFLGAWPQPGFLDLLPLGLAGSPDTAGFSALPLGVWRWQGRGFSVVSLERSILEDVSAQIGFEEGSEPAQIRVQVGDLSQAKFGAWLNALAFARARQVSVGNARLLHVLTQQLSVPLADARDLAERLLDAELVCPLGGQYELSSDADFPLWQSTAWPVERRGDVPADYVAPPLAWFRGLEAKLLRQASDIVLHATVDMQRTHPAP